ncbi:hypothetical protein L1987_10903 [Smallanthus sonchifolius]|uniref:Uncharacterized protein n=1 Tax=Smallanthus sonchifolius TaxID=185202 RepID=A0ACB9JAA6_9ASTR|nr:hypothetical protein L1987_10903 [Smallanthus sonchifolius]
MNRFNQGFKKDSYMDKSGIRATDYKIQRRSRINPNWEFEECANRVVGKRNKFNECLFGQKGRHGFRRNQRSFVHEATRVRVANLSVDVGNRGKPHQTYARNHEQVMNNKESFKREIAHMVEWFYLEYIGFIFDKLDTPIMKDDYEIELLDLYLFDQAKGVLRQSQNAKDRRDLEDNGNSGKDEVVNEITGSETTNNGSPNFKRRRVQAIRDIPPMCGPDFRFANFTISGTKTRAATPESEPEEDEAVPEEFEDQSESSSEELQEDEDENSEDLVIITNDDFM